jgi:hypothetical protein
MTLSPARRTGLAAAAVVALVAGATVADARSAPPPVPQPVVAPVVTTRVICPDPMGSARVSSLVSAFVAPDLPGTDRSKGTAMLVVPKAGKIPASIMPVKGLGESASVATLGRWLPPVTGLATGAFAPGFVADQATSSSGGPWQGVSAVACSASATERWFVGGGSTAGRYTQVVLANPETAAASVDVMVYGPDGEVAAPGGRGVLVPPRGRVRLDLEKLAPGLPAAALHVVVRSGRVESAVSDRGAAGLRPQGIDWVPAGAPPAGRVVVPGIPSAAETVQLDVLAPAGAGTAKIRVVTADGGFVPVGTGSIDLEPGGLVSVNLTKALGQTNGAVEIVSSTPVVAGVTLLTKATEGARERMFAAGAAPLTGPAGIAWLDGGAASRNVLLLTSLGGASRATITRYPRLGKASTQSVDIPSDRTVAVPLPSPDGASSSLVVTPSGPGRLYAARLWVWQDKGVSGFTGYPLRTFRSSATLPPARPDLAAALATG